MGTSTLTQRAGGDRARQDDQEKPSASTLEKDVRRTLSESSTSERQQVPTTKPEPDAQLPPGFPDLTITSDTHGVDEIEPSWPKSTILPASKDSLQAEHGVTIVEKNGRYEYRRNNSLLFDTPATDDGLNRADRILLTAKQYGVEIKSKGGQLQVTSSDGKQNFSVDNSEAGMQNAERMLKMSRDNNGQFRLNSSLNEYEFYSRDAQGKEIKLFSVGANPQGVDKAQTILDTAQRYGVQIRSDNLSYTYVAIVNGTEQVMAQSTATPQGLEKARQQMDAYIESKKAELSQKYDVSFVPAGQKYANVNTREPSVTELMVLETALDKSRASITREDPSILKGATRVIDLVRRTGIAVGTGEFDNPAIYQSAIRDDLQIRFVDGTINGNVAGQQGVEDVYGNRAITITPHRYPTIVDAQANNDGQTRMTLEGTMLHEIAHNAQGNYQYDGDKVAEQMGWQKTGKGWAMRTKDGALYMRNDDGSGRPWQKVNDQGEPIGADDARIAGNEMARRALVQPVSDYFDNPTEMFAEAQRAYRQGGYWTEKLYRDHRDLYTIAKSFDDYELRDQYGVDQQGNSKFIRVADGTIVENTPENRARTIENASQNIIAGEAVSGAAAGMARALSSAAAGGRAR